MATLNVHPQERRRAFWVIEDTVATDELRISIAGGAWLPLAWEGDENWSMLIAGPDNEDPGGAVVLPWGLSGVVVRHSNGMVLLADAGAFNVTSSCWPVDWSPCGGAPEDVDLRLRAEALAVSTLQALTLGRVGNCPITVRPCAQRCCPSGRTDWYSGSGSTFFPHIGARGRWVNSCGCASTCHCGRSMSEVVLQAPVGRIEEVWVYGVQLDPSSYRVDDGDRLVRIDGVAWPSCQDMTQPHDGEDAFAVTYLNSYPVSYSGAIAAGVLAAEFAKACSGGSCRLPAGVTQITRQGTTMQIAADMFAGGLTGIREVDVFTAQYNPHRARVRPQVFSPDLHWPRRVSR